MPVTVLAGCSDPISILRFELKMIDRELIHVLKRLYLM